MSTLDSHGQPFNLRFNRVRRAERDLCELLGLAKGLLADGIITEEEALLVAQWVVNHPMLSSSGRIRGVAMHSIVYAAAALIVTAALYAQGPTLREEVAKHNSDVLETIIAESSAIALDQLLKGTDLIVRGIIGDGVARVSDDEQSIFTTYEIRQPFVSFSAKSVAAINRADQVPRVLSVTTPGRSVPIGQFTATLNYVGLPKPRRDATSHFRVASDAAYMSAIVAQLVPT